MGKRGLARGKGKPKRLTGYWESWLGAGALRKLLAFFSPVLSYLDQKGRGVSKYMEGCARVVEVQVTAAVGYIESVRKCRRGTEFT